MGDAAKERSDAAPNDCLECRLIGSGSMLAISAYFLVQLKAMKPTVSQSHRRFHAGLSAVFAMAGIARLLM
jgi:hypothetical protein